VGNLFVWEMREDGADLRRDFWVARAPGKTPDLRMGINDDNASAVVDILRNLRRDATGVARVFFFRVRHREQNQGSTQRLGVVGEDQGGLKCYKTERNNIKSVS
jgi:hypothetical protein